MIELGDLVKDKITNFEGIVVAIDIWLSGCKRIAVRSQKLNDLNKPLDLEWIDDCQLEIIEKQKIKCGISKKQDSCDPHPNDFDYLPHS